MSLEQAVVQLEQTNAALQEEVVRFRDSAMGFFNIYPTITAGRQAVSDGAYFSVPGNGAYMRLYRRQGSSASLIAEYPSRESMVEAINEATADAEARANAAADRAEVYADNKGFVTLERFRKQATLDLDFAAGDYSVDNGDKLRTTNASEVLTVERATPKWVEGPNGLLREVPPNTIARQWRNGVPQGALIEDSATNLLPWSEDLNASGWGGLATVAVSSKPSPLPTAFYEVTDDSSTSADYLARSVTVADDTQFHCASVFMAAGTSSVARLSIAYTGGVTKESSVWVDLATGNYTASGDARAKVTPLEAGVFRVSVAVPNTGEGNTSARFTLRPASRGQLAGNEGVSYTGSVFVTGAQLEEGSSPSSYIPTTDSPVTRAADNVSRTLGNEFNPSEFTIIQRFSASYTGSVSNFNQGTNRIFLQPTRSTELNQVVLVAHLDNARLFTWFSGEIPWGQPKHCAFSVNSKTGVVRFAVNGVLLDAGEYDLPPYPQNPSISLATTVTQSGCELLPRALTEAELIEVTSL